MPRVTVGGRRLSLAAELPEALAAWLRRMKHGIESTVSGPRDPLVIADQLPELNVVRRDAQNATAFLPSVRSTAGAGNGAAPSLADRVASLWWYHTIDLPGGVVTPGFYDHRPLLPHYPLPADLTGARVADIAAFDGFWAFEMERRGATVVATDIPRTSALDLPPQATDLLIDQGLDRVSGEAFCLAHDALGSKVERILCSVYDLDPATVGTFDFVHVADLLLHLRSPIAALQGVRRITAGTALIVDCFDPTLPGEGLTRYLGGWSGATWWSPALDTLAQMVIDAGFADVEVRLVYALGNAEQPRGPWRAALLART